MNLQVPVLSHGLLESLQNRDSTLSTHKSLEPVSTLMVFFSETVMEEVYIQICGTHCNRRCCGGVPMLTLA